MKNAEKVMDYLVKHGQGELSKKAMIVLASDELTVVQKHGIVCAMLRGSYNVIEGAQIVASTILAFPENSSDFVKILRGRARDFFIVEKDKGENDEKVFQAVVAGLFLAAKDANTLFDLKAARAFVASLSEILFYLLAYVADKTKLDIDSVVRGALTNAIGVLCKSDFLATPGLMAELLWNLGLAGVERVLVPGPFAVFVLNQLRHGVLEDMHLFGSILTLAEAYTLGYRQIYERTKPKASEGPK